MPKSKRQLLFATVVILALMIIAISLIIQRAHNRETNIRVMKSALNGVGVQVATPGDPFYSIYDKAVENISNRNYEEAIVQLNQSLKYIGIGLEKGMVYKRLAEIYKIKGDLKQELFYVEQWPKYSMNAQLNEEASRRAVEIRQILATKN